MNSIDYATRRAERRAERDRQTARRHRIQDRIMLGMIAVCAVVALYSVATILLRGGA